MSQYHASLYVQTTQAPKTIVAAMVGRCPCLEVKPSSVANRVRLVRADESFFVSVDDLTVPEQVNSRSLWERHGVFATVRIIFWLNKGEAVKATRDIGRISMIRCLNEAVDFLEGDFFVQVMDSRPGGIVMWRHGDQIDIDLHRSEWWQPEHLQMFSFPYTLKDLPEN